MSTLDKSMDECWDADCSSLEDKTCISIAKGYATISLPVIARPYTKVGTVETTCCGDPVINVHPTSSGDCAACRITIIQSVCITIPIEYRADIHSGTAEIDCQHSAEEDCK